MVNSKSNSQRLLTRRLIPLAAALLGLVSASAADRILVGFGTTPGGEPTIAGSSSKPRYDGWIEASSLSYGFALIATEGTTRSSPVAETFAFTKRIDKSTPLLQEALVDGTVFPQVSVVYLGSQTPLPRHAPSTIVLHNVAVTGYEAGGSEGGGIPTDKTELNFDRVDWIYRTTGPRDRVGEEIATGFNLATNTPETPLIDDDGDGIPNDKDPDSDNDSLPNAFEEKYGLDPIFDDAGEDPDNDRQTNRSEWLTGTRPDNASSSYGIDRLSYVPDKTEPKASVAFGVIGGRHYRLLGSFDLQTPEKDWVIIEEFDTVVNSPATEKEVSLPRAVVGEMKRMFFKVQVDLPVAR